MKFFCPYCWNELYVEDVLCSKCKRDLKEFSELSFEDKLIFALNHPVKEIRKTVVHIIGLKRFKIAISELEKMLSKEKDPFILIEIIKTLKRIGTEEARDVLDRNRLKFFNNKLILKFF